MMIEKKLAHRKTTQNLSLFLKPCRQAFSWILKSYPIDGTKQLFIVGPPRSGTTLLFQSATSSFDCFFPNHLTSLLSSFPELAFKITRLMQKNSTLSSFASFHGFGINAGLRGTNEFENFFRYTVKSKNDYNDININELVKLVSSFPPGDRIYIFKNLSVTLYINEVAKALPNSYFLFIKRNPIDTAKSIYIAKKRENKAKDVMWYIVPRELSGMLFSSEAEQIITQIYFIRKTIKGNCMKFAPNRFCEVEYENLCKKPYDTLKFVRDVLFPDVSLNNVLKNKDFIVPNNSIVDENFEQQLRYFASTFNWSLV